MLKMRLAVFAAASLGAAQMASAALGISVSFVDNGNSGVQNANPDSLLPGEVAGAPGYEQSNWNNMGRWGGTVAVNDNTGAVAAGVTMTWDSNNTWHSGSGTATPNAKLMNGYIDSLGLPKYKHSLPVFREREDSARNHSHQ